jgi:ribA/ribD-fused uncharacterized protein
MTIKFYKTADKYGFLNNYYQSNFSLYNEKWNTVEHAYQAQKFLNREEYNKIVSAKTPKQARDLGQQGNIRADWNNIKIKIMKGCVFAKFKQNYILRCKLLETENEEIIEDSPEDNFWGQINGVGQNNLGKILMEVRAELLESKFIDELIHFINFGKFCYFGIDIEYDTEHSCNDSGCDYICRCGRIVNEYISSIDMSIALKSIFNDHIPSSDEKLRIYYAIDRILHSRPMIDKNNWDINICGGYYGDELLSVTPTENLKKQILELLEKLPYLSWLETIQELLMLEYGNNLLIFLVNASDAKIIKNVPIENIIAPSDRQFNIVEEEYKNKSTFHYEDYFLPRVIAKDVGGKYSIIDGYHRFVDAKNKQIDKIDIIVIY